MEIIRAEYKEIISELWYKHWRSDFWMNAKQLKKVLSWESSININTANKILKTINNHSNLNLKLEDVFFVENLKWNSHILSRTVEYIYWIKPLSKKEIADLVKYAFDRETRGFSIADVLKILLIISIISIIILYFISHKIQ